MKLTKLDWHAVAGVFACIVLLTLPFAHSVAIRTIALGAAWLAALAAWRSLAVPRIPLLWLFAAWAGLGLLSLTWAVDRDYSASELKTEALYPFLVFALFFALGEQPWLERFRRTLMAATLLAFASAVYWAVFSDWGYTGGFFNGPGMYSTYLVGVYPFALVWLLRRESTVRERWLHAAVLAAILAGGAITHNRMLWIVLAIQTLLLVAIWQGAGSRRRAVVFATMAAFAFGATLFAVSAKRATIGLASATDQIAADIRPQLWDWAAQRIVERPLTGAGFGRGALREAFQSKFGHPTYWHAHNIVLNYGLGMGVWGIALVIAIFGLALAMLWRALRAGAATLAPYALAAVAMVIGMFLKNMTDDLFIRQSALLYWAIVGMVLGAHARQRGGMGDPASILVIRRDNIGDLVCTTPLLTALRERFPGSWIAVYANSYNGPVLAGHPAIDELLAYRKAKHYRGTSGVALLGERVRQLVALRRRRLDWVVLAAPADQPRLRRLARLLAPRRIAGFVADPSASHGVDYVVALDEVRDLHEVDAVFRLAGAFGIAGAPPPLRLAVDAAERQRVAHAIDRLPSGGPIVGVHVSARKPSQRWPAERFVALMRALHERHGARFILLWSPGPADHLQHPGDDDKACAIMAGLAGVPVLAWETYALPALVAGLAACDQIICSDGGAMHVAAALGKPIFSFLMRAASKY